MTAPLSLLINKQTKERGVVTFTSRANASGSKKRQKVKEATVREEEVAVKSRNIQVTISQWQ